MLNDGPLLPEGWLPAAAMPAQGGEKKEGEKEAPITRGER
jgi:hypothetical protein